MSTFIYVDLETTGFSKKNDRVIEIAAYTPFDDKNTFSSLININRIIPKHISNLTGITTDMVNHIDVPNHHQVYKSLIKYLEQYKPKKDNEYIYLIMHNGKRFDAPFLAAEFERSNLDIPKYWRFIDTLPIFRSLIPSIEGGHSLRNLSKVYEMNTNESLLQDIDHMNNIDDHGRALYDCRLLSAITHKIFEQQIIQSSSLLDEEILLQCYYDTFIPSSFYIHDQTRLAIHDTIDDTTIIKSKKKNIKKKVKKYLKKKL